MRRVVLPVHHIPQRRKGECVAACAAMALTYLGLTIAYDRLLKLLHVKTGYGAAFFHILELEKLGVSVIYRSGSLEEIHDHLVHDRPCIAPVKTVELPYWDEDTDHAVVIVGLDSEDIYLNDPAFPYAPAQVSHGDFDLAWLGRDEMYAALMRRD